jgi:hypothetical protein
MLKIVCFSMEYVMVKIVSFSMFGIVCHGQNLCFSMAELLYGQNRSLSAWMECVMVKMSVLALLVQMISYSMNGICHAQNCLLEHGICHGQNLSVSACLEYVMLKIVVSAWLNCIMVKIVLFQHGWNV